MKLALRKARLFMHLLHGMWIVATRFPAADVERRHALNRAWSLTMLRLCGMRLVVHNDAARLDRGALVVANHISWIDVFVLDAVQPCRFLAKSEVRRWPAIGFRKTRGDDPHAVQQMHDETGLA